MRPLYALLAALFLTAVPATAQWDTQSPVPTYLDIRGVAAPTADRVFLATDDDIFDDGGALWESTDGGATWTQRDVPFSTRTVLYGLFFLDDQRGWAHGNASYRTLDGGTTWEELPLLGSVDLMEFYTPDFGYATTGFEHYVSLDGGLEWALSPDTLIAYSFADDLVGLGVTGPDVGNEGIYRTTDGGATFTRVQAGRAKAVAFLSASVALAIVDDTVYRSTDAGATWTAGTSASGRSELVVVSPDIVLAWGRSSFFPNSDGRLLRSGDGGQTWTDLGTVIAEGSASFAVVDAQTVVASDTQGNMHRSADAGQTWTQTFASPGPRPGFLSSASPAFADAQTGYFGYGQGFVLKTTDSGATWSQISSGYGQSLNGIDRFDDGTMMAVGEFGTVLTSTDGVQWALNETFTSRSLEAVDALSGQDVVAVDDEGRLYRSADGGDTWTTSDTVPSFREALDLHFTSLLDGWVVGQGFSSGSIFHTTDGGATWSPGLKPDGDPVIGTHVAVDFVGENGWAAGSSDRYYRTTDGGATWLEEYLPDPSFLSVKDMDFFDASIGYAVGNLGYAARSDDGGVTWTILPTPNGEDDFSAIHLIGPNELWLSTTGDLAYYTATGGQNWAVLDSDNDGFGGFNDITATPEGDAWMVGFQGYIEHFAGPPPPPLNRPPEAAFTFSTTRLTATFTDASTDPDGTVESYFWDFDDGTTSNEQNPTHTFAEEGTYLVRLTVTDDDGATGSIGAIVVVQPGPGGTFGDFTEVTPFEQPFVTPQDEDFWVMTTAPADYDLDGDLDIAVLGFYVVYNESVEYRLTLLRNDGEAAPDEWNFTYIEVPLGDRTAGASDLAWGDVDNDGDPDLVLGTDGETVLYRNDAGTLVLTDTALPGYAEDNDQADFDLQSITFADYDNDGDPDLLLPSVYDSATFSYRTALMRNDGPNGTGGIAFTETDSTFAPTAHAQSLWADYDGDEDLDLLLVHLAPLTDDGFIRLYRNDGGGTFVGEDVLGGLTIEHGEAQWGDYDADGDYDILITGNLGEIGGTFTRAAIRIYENDAGVYTPFEVIDCLGCEGWFDLTAATWADYDSDGDVDILLAGTYNSGSQIDGRARVYTNDAGTFTDSGSELPAPQAFGGRGGTFSWLDLDGEGDLDYFIAGWYYVPGGNGLVEAQMHAYRNDATAQNRAPEPPSGLNASVGGHSSGAVGEQTESVVALSWDPGSDDSTPVAALTYDLEVRRSGAPVAAVRRLPAPGNVSAVTEWELSGLPEGTYTWAVRTVDSAYNGSPAAEGTFTITGNPLAYDLEATNTSPLTVAPGGQVGFDYAITNTTNAAVAGDLYVVAERAGQMVRQRVRSGTLPANRTVTGSYVQQVPPAVPPGTYTYRIIAGTFPDATADQEVFQIVVGGAERGAKEEDVSSGWPVTDAAPWAVVPNSVTEIAEPVSSEALPEVAVLDAAYPNPFSRTTTLRFGLPEETAATLAVYDLMGRRVATLVSDERAAGFHEVAWDASGLASGTYLVRFVTGEVAQTQRLTLLR